MKKKSNLAHFLKSLLIAIGVAIFLVIAVPLAISVYLSPQDELNKSDAIVVISGGDTDARTAEGVKLYEQKWAPKLVFSGAAAEGTVSNALAMKRIAVSRGIKASDILIEEASKTTKENATLTTNLIKGSGFKSIILVTSPYHQRRAYEEFKKALGKDFPIINHSAKDETWRKQNWWENANARLITFGEIMKNAYSLFSGGK